MTSKKYHNKQTLLNLLSDGRFHSGEALGNALGVTRSAIWKTMQGLQKKGLTIQSVNGKGYRIPNGLCLLNEADIWNQLSSTSQTALNRLECVNSIASTNDYLLTQVNTRKPETIACFSEQQTAGKGRRGREWLSPYGTNIYHSLLWYFDKDPRELLGLSLAVAVFVARALKSIGITRELEVKWPNDIHWGTKKLGGILVEMVAHPHASCAMVIGIGINTRLTLQHTLQHTLNRPITSTEEILNTSTDRNQLAARLLNEIILGLQQFESGGLKPFLEEWRSMDSFQGKKVKLHSAQQDIIGTMRGVSDQGELLLECTDGQIKHYLSGEVSLRKISTPIS